MGCSRPAGRLFAMLTHHAHVALALGMLVIAGINAWLMLESFGGRTPKTASRRRAALHRWLGQAYLGVYLHCCSCPC